MAFPSADSPHMRGPDSWQKNLGQKNGGQSAHARAGRLRKALPADCLALQKRPHRALARKDNWRNLAN